MFLLAHRAMVQPDRIEGAKAVEGLLRRSHLNIGKSDEEVRFKSTSSVVGIVILRMLYRYEKR